MAKAAPAAVTIYTDASVSHIVGKGSWGAVIVGGGPDIETGGAFRVDLTCSTTGEAQAMANALHAAIAHQRIRRGTTVLLVSDNQAVIKYLEGGVGQKTQRRAQRAAPAMIHAIAEVRRIVRDCGIEITFRWVRGHQPEHSTDPHAPGNRRADRIARDNQPDAVKKKRERRKAQRQRRAARKREELAAMEGQPHGA